MMRTKALHRVQIREALSRSREIPAAPDDLARELALAAGESRYEAAAVELALTHARAAAALREAAALKRLAAARERLAAQPAKRGPQLAALKPRKEKAG